MRVRVVIRVLTIGIMLVVLLGLVLCTVALAEVEPAQATLRPTGTGVIAGVIYQDWDEDGLRDEEEPGLPEATITLYDLRGKPVREVVSDEDGAYLLSASARGYLLQVTLPEGYTALQESEAPLLVQADETRMLDFGAVLLLRAP